MLQALSLAKLDTEEVSRRAQKALVRLGSSPWDLHEQCAALEPTDPVISQLQQNCMHFAELLGAGADARRLRQCLPGVGLDEFTSGDAAFRLGALLQAAAAAGRLGSGSEGQALMADVLELADRWGLGSGIPLLEYIF